MGEPRTGVGHAAIGWLKTVNRGKRMACYKIPQRQGFPYLVIRGAARASGLVGSISLKYRGYLLSLGRIIVLKFVTYRSMSCFLKDFHTSIELGSCFFT